MDHVTENSIYANSGLKEPDFRYSVTNTNYIVYIEPVFNPATDWLRVNLLYKIGLSEDVSDFDQGDKLLISTNEGGITDICDEIIGYR